MRTTAPPLFTPAFVMLAIADLGYFTAVGVAIYTLPLYVTGPVGSDTAGAGLAFGAFAVSSLILRPFAGRLSDRIGRRPLLVGGALLAAVALALTPFVDSLPMVVVLRLLLGIAEASFVVAGFAALADLAPPSRMGEAISYNSLGLYLGLALGPPLGELLLERGNFTTAWTGAAVVVALSALVVLGIGETRAPAEPTDAPVHLIHRKSLAPGIGFCTSVLAMSGFLAFVSLHAVEVGLAATSLPLFVYGSVVVVCRVVFAKVPDRLPSLWLAAAALVVVAAGLSTMALWTTPVGLITGSALMALGITFSTPAFFSAIFSTAGPSDRGAAAGTASAFLDLGLGGGPIMLGLVARALGIPWAFGAAAGIALLGCVWTVVLLRRKATQPSRA